MLNDRQVAREDSPDAYSQLLQRRIVFLNSEIDSKSGSAVCAQLLCLAHQDPESDIYLYINSPGGSVASGMAIYDVMNFVNNDVATLALGIAASMGQVLLSAGTPGKRFALPHAQIMMHQPSGALDGSASDIRIQAAQMLNIKRVTTELIARHVGRSPEEVARDGDRDRWFTACDAQAYGIVDRVVSSMNDINARSSARS